MILIPRQHHVRVVVIMIATSFVRLVDIVRFLFIDVIDSKKTSRYCSPVANIIGCYTVVHCLILYSNQSDHHPTHHQCGVGVTKDHFGRVMLGSPRSDSSDLWEHYGRALRVPPPIRRAAKKICTIAALVAGLITITWLFIALIMTAMGHNGVNVTTTASSSPSLTVPTPPAAVGAAAAVGGVGNNGPVTPSVAGGAANILFGGKPTAPPQPPTAASPSPPIVGEVKSKSGRPVPAPKPGVKPIQPKGGMAPVTPPSPTTTTPLVPVSTSTLPSLSPVSTRLAFYISVQEPLTTSTSSSSCSDGLLCGCSVHQFARLLRAIYHPDHYYMVHTYTTDLVILCACCSLCMSALIICGVIVSCRCSIIRFVCSKY
jgi:hypothetical protein